MLMPVAFMADLVLHAMAGMHCGFARGLLRVHCAVAQRFASLVLSELLVVASLFGVLFSCWRPAALRHDGGHARWCALLAGRLLLLLQVAWSMLLCDLHCAGLVTVVGVSIFVL